MNSFFDSLVISYALDCNYEGLALTEFHTTRLAEKFELAPDGSRVRPLIRLEGGSFAHCNLPPDSTSIPVSHRTIDEIWYFIGGKGEIWRKQGSREEVVKVDPGVCLSIPKKTHFQFRNTGHEPLIILIVTMPPWPGNQEAMQVKGLWSSNIKPP